MTLQNRVMPDGSIVAVDMRGDFMGNRGILHTPDRTLGRARWTHQNWIICALHFRDRKRTVMQPGRYYTELFFLDEAVALAAGHRPCAECRRDAYNRYVSAWALGTGSRPAAKDMDRQLHTARLVPRTGAQQRHRAALNTLPNGCFVDLDGAAWLVKDTRLLRFSPAGYDASRPRPDQMIEVITPAPTVVALRMGYVPALHAAADP